MSYSQCGTCPLCGAPLYHPMVWHSILPPPVYRTCNCFPEEQTITSTTGTNKTIEEKQNTSEVVNER